MRPFRFAAAIAAVLAVSPPGFAQEPIRIAYIEGLSGPFANVGEMGMRHLQLAIEDVKGREEANDLIPLN